MRVFSHTRLAPGARIALSLGLVLGVTGSASCHTAGAIPEYSARSVSREILPLDATATRYENLYEAIRYLRPEYLKIREQGSVSLVPVAYLNGMRLDDPAMLRHIPVHSAAEVRWVRPNQSSPLYTSRAHFGGGIFVRTK